MVDIQDLSTYPLFELDVLELPSRWSGFNDILEQAAIFAHNDLAEITGSVGLMILHTFHTFTEHLVQLVHARKPEL